MLRARRPQGTAKKRPGTVGQGRSRFETVRDGLRPLGATAHDATRARLRFDDIVSRTEAHHRGTGKPAQKALRAISSSREVAARVAGQDALGIISSAPVAHEPSIADDDLRTPNGHLESSASSRSNPDESCSLSGSMTAGPRVGRQGSDRTTGPFTRGGAHRLASSHQHRRRMRGATNLGGRDEEEPVHRPGAGTR